MKKIIQVSLLLILTAGLFEGNAGTITLVGNGAGGGPIFVSSSLGSIDLGTRLRVGTFSDLAVLSTTIANFISLEAPASYAETLAALNANFIDLGTGGNYGTPGQTTGTVSSSQLQFNTTASLAINGAPAINYNVFTGGINNVTYSASIGVSKNLYIWTAFNNGIAIVRNANGTGTAAWTTPASDLSGVTMNLSGLQVTAGGVVESSEVLLGRVLDYSTGSDLIALIPEPNCGALLLSGLLGLAAMRRLRKV